MQLVYYVYVRLINKKGEKMKKVGIVELIKKAVANEENIHDGQVNWDWVMADVYMDNTEQKLGHDENHMAEVVIAYANHCIIGEQILEIK